MLSPTDEARVAILRQKNLDGTAEMADYKEFVAILRQGRASAVASATAKRKSAAKAAIPSADDLLSELEGL